jgi:PHD/YefM family antitoxin component YafN of YafNO toxin-antitoxin module
MNLSISQLKTNPAQAIRDADEFPLALQSRNKTKAYLVGKSLYDKIVLFIKDYIEAKTVETTDFNKGEDFEKVAKQLRI